MKSFLLSAPSPLTTTGTSELVLRGDDVLSVALLLKVLLITGVLLISAYFILRYYARFNKKMLQKKMPVMQCDAALRLSTRTKVYLLMVDGSRVLITESPSGTHSIVMGDVSLAENTTS